MTAIEPAPQPTNETKLSYDGNKQGERVAVAISAPSAPRSQLFPGHAVNKSGRTRPMAVGSVIQDKEGA